jgi:hypothetical protein
MTDSGTARVNSAGIQPKQSTPPCRRRSSHRGRCPVSESDGDFPGRFCAVQIYEDLAAGGRANEFYEKLARNFDD